MKKYKFAVLTDHSGHSSENSMYAILKELSEDPRCEYIDVISRGLESNKNFFDGRFSNDLKAFRVDKNFAFDDSGGMFDRSSGISVDDCDILLMRLPRPIEDDFLLGLSAHFPDKTIINDPIGILKSSNKAFLLNFQKLCPPMKLCHSLDDILNFSKRFEIVLKPLKEYGGKGILRIRGQVLNDGNQDFDTVEYLENLKDYIRDEGFLAMKFLKNVREGDKRLLVVDGEILASSLRMPAEGSWLCNVAQGGYAVSSEPDDDEIKMVDLINPTLNKLGVMIYGVDTLVNDKGRRVISEINTMSIGGFKQAQEQTGLPVIKTMINKIFKYADSKSGN